MNAKDLLRKIADQRRERCSLALKNPGHYKICEGCSSLLSARNDFCPFCHAYRFDTDLKAILEMAHLLGNRPLAEGCPVLPRITTPAGLTWA